MTDAGLAGEARAERHTGLAARFRDAVVRMPVLVVSVSTAALLGVVVRLTRLGERVLSFDEAYTLATAERSFVGMLEAFRFEANGTLNAIVLWPLLRISESEAMVRTPAVVAGIATIPAVYWAGRELAGHRAALVATALVAVSPAMIGWSVYGRGYAFGILFAVLSFGCLARVVSGRGRTGLWRALYVAAALATAYSSTLAAVTLLPVQAVAATARIRTARALRPWVVPVAALVAGLFPLVALLYVESTYRDPLAWLWRPDFALVRRVGGELAAGPAFFGGAGAGLAGAILITMVAISLVGLVASRPRLRMPGWETRVLLGWAFFPPVLLFVASQFRPMFWGRYLGIIVPAFVLLVAVLLVRMPRILGVVYGAMIAALLLAASLMTPAPPIDFRVAASWIEANRGAGDPLVLYPIEQLPPLSYYARTLRIDGMVPVEEWDDTPLPAGVEGYRRDYDWGDSPVGPPTTGDLARLASRTRSVFVLTYPNLAEEIPLAWAEAGRCDVEWSRLDGLSALSIRTCATPAN